MRRISEKEVKVALAYRRFRYAKSAKEHALQYGKLGLTSFLPSLPSWAYLYHLASEAERAYNRAYEEL